MVKGLLKIVIYVISALLLFLGVVFIISFNLGLAYFFVGLTLTSIAIMLLFFSRERKQIEIRQTISVGGPIKIKEVRCPVCGAVMDVTKVRIVAGRPVVTCNYCGNNFEVTEEPLW